MYSSDIRSNAELLKKELTKQNGIISISSSSRLIGNSVGKWSLVGPSPFDTNSVKVIFADKEFVNTLQLKYSPGKELQNELYSDRSAYILNKEAEVLIGEKNIIGKEVEIVGEKKAEVGGILDEFIYQSLHSVPEPLVIHLNTTADGKRYLVIRADKEELTEVIIRSEQVWNKLFPDDIFNFTLLDEHLNTIYKSEKRLSSISLVFTIVAIVIASLGLLGLISFSTTQRIKEIGIKKVLGASTIRLVYNLVNEFVIIVLVANLFAWPLAWYLLQKWIDTFAYSIELNILLFVFGGLLSLAIAVLTVGFQAFMAASANPVKSIRQE